MEWNCGVGPGAGGNSFNCRAGATLVFQFLANSISQVNYAGKLATGDTCPCEPLRPHSTAGSCRIIWLDSSSVLLVSNGHAARIALIRYHLARDEIRI
jgi:hypothetical protein